MDAIKYIEETQRRHATGLFILLVVVLLQAVLLLLKTWGTP
jgi:hypothetical protein